MNKAEYEIATSTGPKLGLIVLRVDETIEGDFRHYFTADEARLYVSRVRSGDRLTPESIHFMGQDLSQAAALLPDVDFDVIGYACTSATAQLGIDSVVQALRQADHTTLVTDPLSAGVAFATERGLKRIGLVSPYSDEVGQPLIDALQRHGIDIVHSVSFGEETEASVAHIAPRSTADAARAIAKAHELDGIFLSCTNLQTQTILAPLSAELNCPVFSSNQALAWHMRRLSGLQDHEISGSAT